MPDFELDDSTVTCERCDETFTDEDTFTSHIESDHGDKKENLLEVTEKFVLNMDPRLTRATLKEAKRYLAETNQQELYHGRPFKNPKAKIPTKKEPHESADDLVGGVNGYNANPNAGLYDNKLFRDGSSTERTSQLGEAYDDKYWVVLGDEEYKWLGTDDLEYAKREAQKEGGKVYDYEEKEYVVEAHDLGDQSSDFQLHKSDSSDLLRTDQHKLDADGKDTYEIGDSQDAMGRADYRESKTNEADNYPQKAEMTSGEWEDDLKNMRDRFSTESDDVDYDEDYEISMQGEDKELAEIPALEGVTFGFESYKGYPTKANEGKEKSYITETYTGIVDEYDRFKASETEEVNELVSSRKLQGYKSESIAKELTIHYGVSREDALEKVYSVEVSNNDRVANTFFGKMYKECNEAEIAEMKLYCGSDE